MTNHYNHFKNVEASRRASLKVYENNDRFLRDLPKTGHTELRAITFASVIFGIPAIFLAAYFFHFFVS